MDLGWLDVCLRFEDVRVSREFYEGLGFRLVEGADKEGWAVVVNGDARIGLFARQYMEDAPSPSTSAAGTSRPSAASW